MLGLDDLANDLARSALTVNALVRPVAERAGVQMKATLKSDASGHRRLGQLPSTVSYDVETTPTAVAVEVGFEDRGQGELAGIVAFGTATSPPLLDINRGLDAELPKFQRFLAAAVVKGL